MSPHAPTASSTMVNLPAISVNTALPLRHPSKICGRSHGNHRAAQGCACQQTGNKLLHCNPRYGESVEGTLHAGARTSMAALSSAIEGACDHRPEPETMARMISLRSSSIIAHFVSRLSDRRCRRSKWHDSAIGKPVVVGMNPRARQADGDHETRIVIGFHAGWRRDEAYLVSANAPRCMIEGSMSAFKNVEIPL